MNPRRRYHVLDGPLEGAAAVYASDDKAAADQMADRLNVLNFKQAGPWGGGRYWVDDTRAE